MKRTSNVNLTEDAIVEDIYDTVAICERAHLREVMVPSVGDVFFNPSKAGRSLFLGSCDGAFRMFVDSFHDISLHARRCSFSEKFTYTVTVKGV